MTERNNNEKKLKVFCSLRTKIGRYVYLEWRKQSEFNNFFECIFPRETVSIQLLLCILWHKTYGWLVYTARIWLRNIDEICSYIGIFTLKWCSNVICIRYLVYEWCMCLVFAVCDTNSHIFSVAAVWDTAQNIVRKWRDKKV